jgi:hypothetical protein
LDLLWFVFGDWLRQQEKDKGCLYKFKTDAEINMDIFHSRTFSLISFFDVNVRRDMQCLISYISSWSEEKVNLKDGVNSIRGGAGNKICRVWHFSTNA